MITIRNATHAGPLEGWREFDFVLASSKGERHGVKLTALPYADAWSHSARMRVRVEPGTKFPRIDHDLEDYRVHVPPVRIGRSTHVLLVHDIWEQFSLEGHGLLIRYCRCTSLGGDKAEFFGMYLDVAEYMGTCGACAEVHYTGVTTAQHDCPEGQASAKLFTITRLPVSK